MHLRDIPSVNSVLDRIDLKNIQLPRQMVVDTIRAELFFNRSLTDKEKIFLTKEILFEKILSKIYSLSQSNFKPVINGTGIVLHTGLGRAPLSRKLVKEVTMAVAGYSPVEFNLESGKRGERLNHVAPLINSLTGADDSIVVNNNAAALLLCLNTLAEGKEVAISRGQLVEIGGSFRIPDIIQKSGAIMREVGTTNRTHIKDFEQVTNKDTGAIVYAHTSNYRIEGFTKEVTIEDLVKIGRKKRIPIIVDIGSGALFDLTKSGLPAEPIIKEILRVGSGLVTFSGDKLLGGPQAGIISGKKSLISRVHKNPMYRALRCDKLTLALMEKVLRGYSNGSPGKENLAYQMLITPRNILRRRGERLLLSISKDIVNKLKIRIVDSVVEAGSGSLPIKSLESCALQFATNNIKPTELAKRFRDQEIPVIGYIKGNIFTIDLKAVDLSQMKTLSIAIKESI